MSSLCFSLQLNLPWHWLRFVPALLQQQDKTHGNEQLLACHVRGRRQVVSRKIVALKVDVTGWFLNGAHFWVQNSLGFGCCLSLTASQSGVRTLTESGDSGWKAHFSVFWWPSLELWSKYVVLTYLDGFAACLRVGCVRGLSSEPSSSKVCRRNLRPPRRRRESFGGRNFCEASALHSVRVAAWKAQNCGKAVALAGCLWRSLPPTCAAKIWEAEILAKRRRHAASRLRRGGPKIVVRWLHSRFAVGTCFFQGLPLEPSSSKVAPRKFWMQEFVRSIGATQRFDHTAGGPKLWQVRCISGLSSELASANLGREHFANHNNA